MKTIRHLFILGMAFGLAVAAHAAPKEEKAAKAKEGEKATAKTTETSSTTPDISTDKSARVTVLDKQTNRKQVLVLGVGTPQTVGTLQVKLGKCMPDYAATLGQDVAWLDITETTGRTDPWFSGWMFNTFPEVSTLDHPRYDVQLQSCGTKARQIIRATGAAPIVESAPVADTESGGGNSTDPDPFYVPGVNKAEDAPEAAAPQPQPDAEAPATPATPTIEEPAATEPAPQEQPAAAPSADQQDLHQMMDSGQY